MLLRDFGGGNDCISWFYGYHMSCALYLFNDITGLIMNNWDKVEKSKRKATDEDIRWEYVKIACFCLLSCVYFYYIILGK